MKAIIIMLLSVSLSFSNCIFYDKIPVKNGPFTNSYNIAYMCIEGYLFVNVAFQGNTFGTARADGLTQVFELDKDGKSIPKRCSCRHGEVVK